jgi:Mrp family chromosome partitioning ATPase
MAQLLEAIARDFDVVLLDAPPLLPVTDAAILSRHTTGALVVVATGRTTSGQVQGALKTLETVEAKVGGVILTMVPTRGADAYGYGYGYGGYGGYGEYVAAAAADAFAPGRKKGRSAGTDPQTAT